MSTPAQPLSEADSRLWAMFAHLSGIICGLLITFPLIVKLVQGPKDAFVKKQATEALNWQILVVIGYVVCYLIGGLLSLIPIIGWLLTLVIWIVPFGSIVFMIIGGIKAHGGEEYRYPFNWRIVK